MTSGLILTGLDRLPRSFPGLRLFLSEFMAIKPHDSKNPSWKILLLSSEPRKEPFIVPRTWILVLWQKKDQHHYTRICLFIHKTRALNQAMSEGPSSLAFQSPVSDPIGNLHLHINCHLVHFQRQRLAWRLVAGICSNLLILSEAKECLFPHDRFCSIWHFPE